MERNASFPTADVQLIQIHLAWAHLDLTAANVPEIQALIAGDEDTVQELAVTLEGTKLLIEQPQYGLSLKISSGKWLQVCLRVPREWCGEIDASTISGALCARNLTGSAIVLDTVSGTLHGQQLSADSLKLRTVSGALVASSPKAGQAYLRTLSGDVAVQDAAIQEVRVNTVSGAVSLAFANAFDTLNIQTVSGDQQVFLPCEQVQVKLMSALGKLSLTGVTEGDGPRIAATTVTAGVKVMYRKAEAVK